MYTSFMGPKSFIGKEVFLKLMATLVLLCQVKYSNWKVSKMFLIFLNRRGFEWNGSNEQFKVKHPHSVLHLWFAWFSHNHCSLFRHNPHPTNHHHHHDSWAWFEYLIIISRGINFEQATLKEVWFRTWTWKKVQIWSNIQIEHSWNRIKMSS